ncbi:hypothetical protein CTA2_7310 [Colletotrichum tanaceti]|nr:hypothetical protein CTA2_7310 [Colletotrichum tanaceti]
MSPSSPSSPPTSPIAYCLQWARCPSSFGIARHDMTNLTYYHHGQSDRHLETIT